VELEQLLEHREGISNAASLFSCEIGSTVIRYLSKRDVDSCCGFPGIVLSNQVGVACSIGRNFVNNIRFKSSNSWS